MEIRFEDITQNLAQRQKERKQNKRKLRDV